MRRQLGHTALALIAGFSGAALQRAFFFQPLQVLADTNSGKASVVRTSKLELVDSRGNVRASLEVMPDGNPKLQLGTDTGLGQSKLLALTPTNIVMLESGNTLNIGNNPLIGFGVHVTSREGTSSVGADKNGGPGFALRDVDGAPRVVLAVVGNLPMLTLFDRQMKMRSQLGALPGGRGFINLFDSEGNSYWSVPANAPPAPR